MPRFMAEQYFSRTDGGGARSAVDAAHRAAAQLTCEGTSVELVSSAFVPQDETCIFIYEADSLHSVRKAAERAALALEYVAHLP